MTTRLLASLLHVFIVVVLFVSPLQARPGDIVPLAPISNSLVLDESYAEQQGAMHEAWAKARLGDRTSRMDPLKTSGMDNYDVFFYDLDINLYDDTQQLSGTVRMEALVTGVEITNLEMHLSSSTMSVSAVMSGDNSVTFAHANDLVDITLDRAYAPGEVVIVEVSFGGNPEGDYFGWDSYGGQPLIWTLSEPYGARTWWPCKDLNTDKADSVDIRVTVREDLVVASNGTLLETNVIAPGRKQYVWQERYPIATYLVSLAIHPYTTFSSQYFPAEGGPMDVDFYVIPQFFDQAQSYYPDIVDMLGAFSEAFGEYPFINEKYGHAHFPWGGGMEHQTCTSLSYNAYSHHIMSHELAHQWFGDMITCADFGHIWLNEGFATWAEAYWLEVSDGVDAYHAEMDQARYLGGGSIFVEDPNNFWAIFDYYLSYQKASWVPHMLRHIMGDEDFFAGLLAYREAFEFDSATTEQFRDVMAQVSGLNLNQFFQQWIYETYHPQYRYSWTSEEVMGSTRVRVYVEQVQDTGTIFEMPLDIRVQSTVGQETFVVQNTEQQQWYTFQVAGEVTEVALDPDDWILCTKVLDPGTSSALDVNRMPTGILANSPNPFNPRTEISFAVEDEGYIELDICDLRGRHVKTLVAGNRLSGNHEVFWNGCDKDGGRVASGTYFAVLKAAGITSHHKLTLVQ